MMEEEFFNLTPESDSFELTAGLLGSFPEGLRAFQGSDTVVGSGDPEFFNGNQDSDTLFGGDGADTIHGGRNDDFIYGNQGNDSLLGDRSNDVVFGGQGNDILIGGNGDDILVGDKGQDILIGGEGTDAFVLRTDTAELDPAAADTIVDFNSSEDEIGLTEGLSEASLALEAVEEGTLIRVQGSNAILGRVNNVSPEQLSGRFVAADAALDDNLGSASDLGTLNGTLTRSDFVGDSDLEDWYRFSIDRTSDFSLILDGLSADADVELFQDSDGNGEVDFNEVLSSSEAASTSPEAINLNLDRGTYSLRVKQYEGDTNYNLTVTATPFDVAPDRAGNTLSEARDLGLISETEVNDFVGNPDPVDVYRFSLDTNNSFDFTLDPDDADASLEVIQDFNNNGVVDNGEVLNVSSASANNPGQSFGSLSAGTYYLRVSQGSADTDYQLDLLATPGSLVEREVLPAIEGNDTIQESLSNTDFPNPDRFNTFADDYKLTDVVSGQEVQVSLNSNEFDTYLQVVNAFTGESIVENDDIDVANGNYNSALSFTVEDGVEYIVRVTSFESPGLGDYTLTTVAPETVVGEINPGQSLNGDLSNTDFGNPSRTGSFSDDYRLTGIAPNQQVQIDLSSTEFDGYLQLVDEETGEVIGENDDIESGNLNSQLTFTVQSGIDYLVRVTSYNEDAVGNYSLSASLPASIDGVATIGTDESVEGYLDETDQTNPLREGTFKDDYRLTDVTAGEQIRINLDSDALDTYLQLVNAATGEVIAENDDLDLSNLNNFNNLVDGLGNLVDGLGNLVENNDANADLNFLNLTNSELIFTVQPEIDYLVRVTSFAENSTGSYSLSATPESTPDPDPTPDPEPVTDFFSENIRDAQLQTQSRQLAADGVLSRNDMLALLRDVQDERIVDRNELEGLKTLVNNSSRFRMPEYVKYLSNQAIENATANINASSFESLVGRWFLGTVPPSAAFTRKRKNFEFQYAEVQGDLIGAAGADPISARISHIDQGQFGNCAFLAAVGAVFGSVWSDNANDTSSSIIDNMIIPNGDGTYTVRFYSTPGNAEYVTVDSRVVTQDSTKFFGATADEESRVSNPNNNAIWVPLVERAYAQWRGEEVNQNGYNVIGNGDNIRDPLQRVTGRDVESFTTESGYSNSISFEQIQNALNSGEFVTAGSKSSDEPEPKKELIVYGHAYSVTHAYINPSGEQRIIVRNPWGVDSWNEITSPDGVQDGFIDLSYSEFEEFYSGVAITSR
ncbi:C2 family cysteine protease [Phormidium sp. CCY1219]|uniref:C2 family cysteine protease n=1 Tax=Phormidium sp. CCY1219 TaxID=2886104 RepID=UPI002D1E9250|nr:C2 family cysteine protease [Phormidium sp. CCY1219]MEB3826121.1 hypothetical protein [Phormidium sp. CCY1219]